MMEWEADPKGRKEMKMTTPWEEADHFTRQQKKAVIWAVVVVVSTICLFAQTALTPSEFEKQWKHTVGVLTIKRVYAQGPDGHVYNIQAVTVYPPDVPQQPLPSTNPEAVSNPPLSQRELRIKLTNSNRYPGTLTSVSFQGQWNTVTHGNTNGSFMPLLQHSKRMRAVYAEDESGRLYDVLSVTTDRISHEMRIEIKPQP
jgi:hypothetical protein